MEVERKELKSRELETDMLFVLRELHTRKKLSEQEYLRATMKVREGKY